MWRSIILTLGIIALSLQSASADPIHLKVYKGTFPRTREMQCAICHAPNDKRRLNEYGLKLHQKLDNRRTQDPIIIHRALEELGPAE